MTASKLAVTVAGAAAIVWVLWYFLAAPDGRRHKDDTSEAPPARSGPDTTATTPGRPGTDRSRPKSC